MEIVIHVPWWYLVLQFFLVGQRNQTATIEPLVIFYVKIRLVRSSQSSCAGLTKNSRKQVFIFLLAAKRTALKPTHSCRGNVEHQSTTTLKS